MTIRSLDEVAAATTDACVAPAWRAMLVSDSCTVRNTTVWTSSERFASSPRRSTSTSRPAERSRQTHHAFVKIRRGGKNHQAIRVSLQCKLNRLLLHARGHVLALRVLCVQLLGQHTRGKNIGRGQKFKGSHGGIQPASRVQARTQPEADVA